MSNVVVSSAVNSPDEKPAEEARQRRAGWLARVYRAHDRKSQVARVAARLAATDPDFDDVRMSEIARPLFLSDLQVRKALDRLLEEELVDLRPSIRVGAIRVKLIL